MRLISRLCSVELTQIILFFDSQVKGVVCVRTISLAL